MNSKTNSHSFYATMTALCVVAIFALCGCATTSGVSGLASVANAFDTAAKSSGRPEIPTDAKIICVEQNSKSVIIFDANASDWNNPNSIKFRWSANTAPEIRDADRVKFGGLTDCKSVDGGAKILVSASHGGIALLDAKTGAVIFYTSVASPSETWKDVNPHSSEILPDGNIAVASSYGKRNIILLSVPENCKSPDEIKQFPIPFISAHGAIWDSANKLLWVLGWEEFAGFSYNFDKQKPELKKVHSFKVQTNGKPFGGHDLSYVPNTDILILTGDGEIKLFDTKTHQFATVEIADNQIKSMSKLPSINGNGAIIVMKPSKSYWSDSIRFYAKNFPTAGKLDGAKFYKARWFAESKGTKAKVK